jgi:hypothetical protein
MKNTNSKKFQNPIENISQSYRQNSKHTELLDYGAFLELNGK